MKKLLILVLSLSFAIAVSTLQSFISAEEEIEQELIIYVGQTKTVPVNTPTRVVIGKPEIADAISATDTEITLAGKAAGATTFVVWDKFGEQDYRIRVFPEDMRDIKQRVDTMLSELGFAQVYAKAVDSEGKVLLLGEVKTAQERERLLTSLGELKDKIVDLMKIREEEGAVEIDVQVLELDQDATNTLGMTWPGSVSLIEKGSPGISAAGTKWSTLFKVLNFQRGSSAGADPFTVKLDALVQEGKARILSRPRLACQSGKEAEMLVGGEKPILTTQSVSGGGASTEVEYKEYGIKMKIKPTITEDDRIKLALNIEVSDVGEAEILGEINAPTAKAYPLIKRNASTELFISDGQTLSIGGLIRRKTEEDIRKTPWLGDIPVLGMLFRKKTYKVGGGTGEQGDKELFITLTPTIMRSKTAEKAVSGGGEQKSIVGMSSTTQGLPPELQNYVQAIQNRIFKAIHYPKEAMEAGWEGTLKLKILLAANGSLKDITVSQSSGYKMLDDSGQNTVKQLSPFPPFPAQVKLEELRIEIPIIYHKN